MNDKISILYVHHFPGMGGATMSLFYMVEKLDKTLFTPTVLFLGEGPAIPFFREQGIHVLTMQQIPVYAHAHGANLSFFSKKPWLPITTIFNVKGAVPGLVKWFQQNPFDLVHLNTSPLLPFAKAASLCGIKVVWHVRETLCKGYFGIRRAFVRKWISKYADQIIAISNVEAERLGKSGKITVVYNYVDFQKFNWRINGQPLRQELGIHDSDFVVLNLGGLIHSKGADIFVEAAKHICKRHPDIKFVIAGEKGNIKKPGIYGKLKLTVKQILQLKTNKGYEVFLKIRKNRLEQNIILTGMRTDIPQLLAASNLICWTATVPHFSRPVIEAAAMKKTSVATDFPNTLETIKPSETGLLFKNRDAKGLASLIEKLYANRPLLTKLGENAHALALEKFNAERNFRIIEDCYLQLIRSAETPVMV